MWARALERHYQLRAVWAPCAMIWVIKTACLCCVAFDDVFMSAYTFGSHINARGRHRLATLRPAAVVGFSMRGARGRNAHWTAVCRTSKNISHYSLAWTSRRPAAWHAIIVAKISGSRCFARRENVRRNNADEYFTSALIASYSRDDDNGINVEVMMKTQTLFMAKVYARRFRHCFISRLYCHIMNIFMIDTNIEIWSNAYTIWESSIKEALIQRAIELCARQCDAAISQ